MPPKKGLSTLITLIFITTSLLFSGCAVSKSTDIHLVKCIISASVKWDEDYEPDGVQFVIRPLDSSGFLVKDDCIVNAALWIQQDKNKGALIQEWPNIKIDKKDYEGNYGARIYLEYTEYVPPPGENGILHAEVITSSGERFEFDQTNVKLRYRNLPGVQQQAGCCP